MDGWRAASFLREFPQRVKCPTAEVVRGRNRREQGSVVTDMTR